MCFKIFILRHFFKQRRTSYNKFFWSQEQGEKLSDIHEKKGIYTLKYKDKKYRFTFLSDEDIQKEDKKYLYKYIKRNELSMIRTLNIACKLFPNNQVIIAKTNIDDLVCLIETNGKIIDYSKNIIMSKEEYYDLFEVKELNRLDKYDIYLIYSVICDFEAYDLTVKLLLPLGCAKLYPIELKFLDL